MITDEMKAGLSSLTRFGFEFCSNVFCQVDDGPYVRLADVEALVGGKATIHSQSHQVRATRAVESMQKLAQTTGDSNALRAAIDAVACIPTTTDDFGVSAHIVKLEKDTALQVLQKEFMAAVTKEGEAFTDELAAANLEAWGKMYPEGMKP